MTFQHIAQTFAQGLAGTDQFKAFYKGAFALMKADPDNAALYFVVGVAAHSYVQKFEDQAVDPAQADQAKATLDAFNARLLESLSQAPEKRLAAVSAVALDYEWNVQAF
ncbi:hypothetical protein [Hydrogenophaga sp.]|uniref:hypothetical protein n=1 Tax=Hydrogenophaga sp. TaxID=1904254 RepID=UPI002FCB21CF